MKSILYSIFSITFIIFIIIGITGCQSEVIESTESIDGPKYEYVEGWKNEFFVKENNSFLAAYRSVLYYYGYDDIDISEDDISIVQLLGECYLYLFDKVEVQTGLSSVFVDTDYQLVLNEIKSNRPVITMRMVRNVIEDFIVLSGVDHENQLFIGQSILTDKDVVLPFNEWKDQVSEDNIHWTLVITDDQDWAEEAKINSDLHWLQIATKAYNDHDYKLLQKAIDKLTILDFEHAIKTYLHLFNSIVIEQKHNEDIESLLQEYNKYYLFLNEVKELNLNYHWILKQKELYTQYSEEISLQEPLATETLQALLEIYESNGDDEKRDYVYQLLLERGIKF
jgi:hypothetical protein